MQGMGGNGMGGEPGTGLGGVPGGSGNGATSGGSGTCVGGVSSGTPGTASAATGGNATGQPGATSTDSGQTVDGPALQAQVVKPEGYVAGRPAGDPPPNQGRSDHPQVATALRPGEWHPSEESAPPPRREDDSKDKDRNHHKPPRSMAESRGLDWGLRDSRGKSIPVARPIRIACYPDRLILVPERGTGQPTTIPMTESTERSMDQFMPKVWEYMDSWGIAGKDMYWRPILHVYVAPGAEQRFEEFTALLQGSGLTVERKQ